MNKVKWGIIGSGNIANAFAHSVKYCQDSELVSIFGRNEEAVKQFSTKFAIEPYTNLDTFFSSDQIDAVYIATPHSSHFTYSLEAIKNSKHILCEKPLTMNYFCLLYTSPSPRDS